MLTLLCCIFLGIFFFIAVAGIFDDNTPKFLFGLIWVGIVVAVYPSTPTIEPKELEKAGCEKVGYDNGNPYFRCPNQKGVIFADEFIQPEANK